MKFVISSDVHIFDFQQFNSGGNRLKQFPLLAHRLNAIGREEGSKDLILAGDIIHKAVLRPYVVHVAKEFFDILRLHYTNIYYIVAQHDADSKAEDLGYGDSLIPIICPEAKYMDGQILELDNNRTMAFSNWRPEQNWSFIKDKVDILIGHLTLHPMYGQEYDCSKYELGFFGDIHQKSSYDNGRTNTINVPMPNYISDDQEGSVVVLETDDLSWKRVLTESEDFKYLKIYYEDEVPAGLEGYPNLALVGRSKVDPSIQHIHTSVNVDEVIKAIVSKLELGEIHSQLTGQVDRTDVSPLNLNFRLRTMEINNFRSIDRFVYDFDSGLTTITGHNGAGKSSFMGALDYVLRGSSTARTLVKKGTDNMSVTITLDYDGRSHTIIRGVSGGSGIIKYIVDGEEMVGAGSRQIAAEISAKLPFLAHYELMYRSQEAPGLLTSYGYNDRINMVSELLGLSLIGKYHAVAKTKLAEATAQVNRRNTEIEGLKRVILEYSDVDFSLLDNKKNLEDQLAWTNEYLKSYEEDMGRHRELALVQNSIKSTQDMINSLNITLTGNEEAEIQELRKQISDGESLIAEFTSANKTHSDERAAKKQRAKSIESDIESLKKQTTGVMTACPSCKRAFDPSDYENVLQHLQDEIAKKTEEANLILEDIQKTAEPPHAESDITEIRNILNDLRSKITTINTKIENYNKVRGLEEKMVTLKLQEVGIQASIKYKLDEITSKKSELQGLADECNRQLGAIDGLQKQWDKLKSSKTELADAEKCLEEDIATKEVLTKYAGIFAPSGDVTASVFKCVADEMTDGRFKVRTVRELASGETRIDFDIELQVHDLMLPYGELSGGQRTYADLFFMSKLFKMSGVVGCLILDESLRALDPDALEEVVAEIKSAPINSIILSTHVESFQFYDARLMAQLVDNTTRFSVHGKV
jgi:DNA repair exonuclease SbcCD ATPase subunit